MHASYNLLFCLFLRAYHVHLQRRKIKPLDLSIENGFIYCFPMRTRIICFCSKKKCGVIDIDPICAFSLFRECEIHKYIYIPCCTLYSKFTSYCSVRLFLCIACTEMEWHIIPFHYYTHRATGSYPINGHRQ